MSRARDTADQINRVNSSAADATAITVDSSENVGIGTSTDSGKLNIYTSGAETQVKIRSDSTQAGNIYFTDATSGYSGSLAYDHADNSMRFATNGTGEKMRIDSSGNVGIGTSSPDTKVQIKGGINSSQLILGGTDGRGLKISTFNQGGQNDSTAIYDAQDTEGSAVNSHHVFKSGGTETLRIRGDGDLFWHDTPSSSSAGIAFTNITHPSISISGGADTSYRHRIVFTNGNGTVGIISTSGSSTAYGTSSDYRLKENVVDLTGASARVNQLNPSRFNFIADGTDTVVDGFLAHEVATVVPEAITGTKDAMMDEEYEVTPAVLDEDGNVTTEAVMGTRSVPDYQGIDQSKLVPLLTAALQEALTEIASLKTRVEALEA